LGTRQQGREWINPQRECLRKRALKTLLPAIEALPIAAQLWASTGPYLSKNASRRAYIKPQRQTVGSAKDQMFNWMGSPGYFRLKAQRYAVGLKAMPQQLARFTA